MTSVLGAAGGSIHGPGYDAKALSAHMRQTRNFFFLMAVVLLNYTLLRPSPVDVSFTIALLLTIFCSQRFSPNTLSFLTLVFIWTIGLLFSSMPHAGDPEVVMQLFKICYAISIGVCAALVVTHWTKRNFQRFLRVWIGSAIIASTLGTIGFAGGIGEFTWDGRAKGLFDDPNMYGAFLIPALLSSLYFLFLGRSRLIYGACTIWLTLGVLLSFSRIAIAACFMLAIAFLLIVNRQAMLRTLLSIAGVAAAVLAVGAFAAVLIDGFDEKVLDRLTFAKEYDLGEQGRLRRYLTSFDLMMDSPLGLGTLQYQKMFPEPIHNIWLSSFMNYGWGAGFAWSCLVLFGVVRMVAAYRRTRDPLIVTLLFCWLGILACALLHEAERWRHLWLFTGLIWGTTFARLADDRELKSQN